MNVTRGDIKRLEPGQYLNDTLIEFGLKYVRGVNLYIAADMVLADYG